MTADVPGARPAGIKPTCRFRNKTRFVGLAARSKHQNPRAFASASNDCFQNRAIAASRVSDVGLEPMLNYTKVCVYMELFRPALALISTSWYDPLATVVRN
jgi:hypothetical protein